MFYVFLSCWTLFFANFVAFNYFHLFWLRSLPKIAPASLLFPQTRIGKWGSFSSFFFLLQPAWRLGDAVNLGDAALSTAVLLNSVKLMPLSFHRSGLTTMKLGLCSQNLSSVKRELPQAKVSLITVYSLWLRRSPSRSSTWTETPPPRTPTTTSRTDCCTCSPLMTTQDVKQSKTFLSPVICSNLPWCPRCSACFLLVTNPVFFYVEPSSSVCLLTSGPI